MSLLFFPQNTNIFQVILGNDWFPPSQLVDFYTVQIIILCQMPVWSYVAAEGRWEIRSVCWRYGRTKNQWRAWQCILQPSGCGTSVVEASWLVSKGIAWKPHLTCSIYPSMGFLPLKTILKMSKMLTIGGFFCLASCSLHNGPKLILWIFQCFLPSLFSFSYFLLNMGLHWIVYSCSSSRNTEEEKIS